MNYGTGGRAFGVVLHFTSNECLVENNIFEHLRHSMLVQVGANGNVLAYNYSFDPFWTSIPSNAAGDIVLHGNYPYSNLFEQNVCQNIVIDNSHGPNGPYNTFFRNRAESYGIFFSSSNSPMQNLLGNDIPNTSIPFSLINYTIQGAGHFLHGNNNKGMIDPIGTDIFPDTSYAYFTRPVFVPIDQWAGIGTPNVMGATDIPALTNYDLGYLYGNSCGSVLDISERDNEGFDHVLLFPVPANSTLRVISQTKINTLKVTNMLGQEILVKSVHGPNCTIDLNDVGPGMYFITMEFDNEGSMTKRFLKTS